LGKKSAISTLPLIYMSSFARVESQISGASGTGLLKIRQ
jgi:hypothetical protein